MIDEPHRVRCAAFLAMLLVPVLFLMLHPSESTVAANVSSGPAAYTQHVQFLKADHTLLYGNEVKLREKPPLLPDGTYAAFVRSMPIVCVDVLLTRSDGAALLVLRHQEPVRGLHWFPGGRLLMGEGFSDAALRKVRKEIGLTAAVCRVLGTWNTLFEQSAWGAPTQTVNILVHATTEDPRAAAPRICGDKRGKCADGSHGQYKWVQPDAVADEDVYVREGMDALQEKAGTACDTGATPAESHRRYGLVNGVEKIV